MEREWELQAACRHEDPDLWFSKRSVAEAKRICLDECPVRAECLEAVLARESQTADTMRDGIIAGLTGAQRAAVAAERRKQVPVEKRNAPPGPGRAPAPCGTKSAYNRHRRRGETPCQACNDANNAAYARYRATGSTKVAAGR
ncbi:WhiB family transcriptional regulator [Streptomyces sp. 5-8]|uniref:WhiB family transcriptional regulator n=1 Tax=Streptomyces musisoli TaxID=2802280 RepID=A0ABS1P770_9ACTN|nr:WhiB family transcriptional regulator [Streptomyces musisoli]MBL1108024.1 WhiB family transcriptional regulator [Streptomyces musisoli]